MRINKNSKFYTPPTFKQRMESLKYSILFWKGRSKGIIYTRNIKLDDFRYIFFPKRFAEKYGYLGTSVWNEAGDAFKALYPLVLALDYEAKPKLCPRWFLRFLHVFGSDKSIVRVRNRKLNELLHTLTKGIAFIDWKTKWHDYDLRISIYAPKHLQNLANDIEYGFYSRGRQEELVAEILELDPNAPIIWGSIERFEKQLEELGNKQDEQNWKLVRERDGLTKHSVYVMWIEFNDEGSFKDKHDKPAIGRSLIMSPFNEFFTWQTTSITEIVEEREDYIKFNTRNSVYELWKLKND